MSLAETIKVRADGALTYVDDSLSVIHFAPVGSGFVTIPGQPSDIRQVEALEDGYRITYRNQWIKQFRNLGTFARLAKVTDNSGNSLSLSYDGQHRLRSIDGQNGRRITISRNQVGQITRIRDDQGREVAFDYNPSGELSSTTDLGGNVWAYKYSGGRLHQVVDPLGNPVALITYHSDGRVKHTKVYHAKHTFTYAGNETTVKDGADYTSTFTHNDQGITTRAVNPQGHVSEVVLNASNDVQTLHHQGRLRGDFSYDAAGNLDRLVRYDADGQVEFTYLFDRENRLVEVTGSDGTLRTLTYGAHGNLLSKAENGRITEYGYNALGDLTSQSFNGETTEYRYDADGLLTELEKNGAISHFRYSAVGRLAEITFPEGNRHTYQYDALGFRTRTERRGGTQMEYQYDSTGNLVESFGETVDGHPKGQQLTVDENHQLTRVDFAGGEPLVIEYDEQGNATLLNWGDNRIMACEYDPAGRLTRIEDNVFGASEYVYNPGEPDIRKQRDDRTASALSEQRRVSATLNALDGIAYSRPAGSPWAAVTWNAGLAIFDLATEIGLVVPDATRRSADQRRRLYDVVATEPGTRQAFDKASNSFFLPPEYATVNCEQNECWIFGKTLDAPSTVTVGQAFSMDSAVISFGYECLQTMFHDWLIDGVLVATYTGGSGSSLNWTQNTAGTFQVQARSYCCGGTVSATAFVDAEPPPVSIRLTMFIPLNHVKAPVESANGTYGADNTLNWATGQTFRAQQTAIVTPGIGINSSGKAPGIAKRYQESQLSTSGSCVRKNCNCPAYPWGEKIVHLGMCLSPNENPLESEPAGGMNTVNVTQLSSAENQVKVKLSGDPYNPLVDWGTGPRITYEFTVTITQESDGTQTYHIDGEHDGFPAYKLELNNSIVYFFDPIISIPAQTPLSLYPPMEWSITGITGQVP